VLWTFCHSAQQRDKKYISKENVHIFSWFLDFLLSSFITAFQVFPSKTSNSVKWWSLDCYIATTTVNTSEVRITSTNSTSLIRYRWCHHTEPVLHRHKTTLRMVSLRFPQGTVLPWHYPVYCGSYGRRRASSTDRILSPIQGLTYQPPATPPLAAWHVTQASKRNMIFFVNYNIYCLPGFAT
jgi:hypothetical protein